tara:strand:- start:4 stop:261 length:258 start_codon:yes stop_codon:yes gene_type:complete
LKLSLKTTGIFYIFTSPGTVEKDSSDPAYQQRQALQRRGRSGFPFYKHTNLKIFPEAYLNIKKSLLEPTGIFYISIGYTFYLPYT